MPCAPERNDAARLASLPGRLQVWDSVCHAFRLQKFCPPLSATVSGNCGNLIGVLLGCQNWTSAPICGIRTGVSREHEPSDEELSDEDEARLERGIRSCARHLADLKAAYDEPLRALPAEAAPDGAALRSCLEINICLKARKSRPEAA